MIVVMKKSNILLVGLIFMLLVAIYSLNLEQEGVLRAASGEGAQKTVILDPGHGGEDPGAVGNFIGLKEKELNLKIALLVKELLEKDGFNVIMTREDDRLEYAEGTTDITEKRRQDLTRRKKIMDESGADIVVSIHMNKFQESQYYGAQTFYPPDSPESLKLATLLQKSLREIVDPQNTRSAMLKKEKIVILRDLKTTTAMVECGFLSNEQEERNLATEEHQQKLAQAITEGIKNYFK